MEPKFQKLHREERLEEHASETRVKERTYDSIETMLRHDSVQHPIPDSVTERVGESVRQAPKPSLSWWARFLQRRQSGK